MTKLAVALGAILLGIILLPVVQPVLAQERSERIIFASGRSSQTVQDSIAGYETVNYRINVRAGQRLAATLKTDNASNYFNIWAPGASEAIYNSSTSGELADVIVQSSGDYRIQVYLMRNAARRNETADYSLRLEVTGGNPANGDDAKTVPDYADGLSGGPDFWEVANVAPGDRLNVRSCPTAQAPIVVRLRNGAVLRNLGCRMNGQTRWCKVERREGSGSGWAAGRFLVESGG
ncbi:SH3 domain-containing protein [Aminobacter aminovorans]|uniref:Inhibitor of g-type lysozyme n=1 Tax=Aminobacter aminovorans TaxID=83263 RepID=A0A380WQX9_AMIAI|nr:SH3 domain-containing protein [Aminobacter aminovorans]TCS30451.1 SH3 domain-containing protein [Aminobacter aminovorans]SUU91300.1 Inhibitor of g-type lysozyme precursor [Aminobacter aminovorans]